MKTLTKSGEIERKLPVVAIIFNDKGEVLMVQRQKKGDKWNMKWAFPGGGIEFGENPKDTAIRETKEETGLDIKIKTDRPIIKNYFISEIKEDVVSMAYPAIYAGGQIDTTSDEGTNDARWFRLQDIDLNECLPFTKELIEEAGRLINI